MEQTLHPFLVSAWLDPKEIKEPVACTNCNTITDSKDAHKVLLNFTGNKGNEGLGKFEVTVYLCPSCVEKLNESLADEGISSGI